MENLEEPENPLFTNIELYSDEEVMTLSVLANSLLLFINEVANYEEHFFYGSPLNSDAVDFVLGEDSMRVCIIDWQMHHGYKMDVEWAITVSINDIVRKALELGRFDLPEYYEKLGELQEARAELMNKCLNNPEIQQAILTDVEKKSLN
jgi:hypothetical protein